MSKPSYRCRFTAELFRVSGTGGWVFSVVPPEHAPDVTVGWGRTPVRASVDGRTWDTSVWREKSGRTLLAVPKKVRGEKDHADSVDVALEYSIEYRNDI
jgi:hypothetical protein